MSEREKREETEFRATGRGCSRKENSKLNDRQSKVSPSAQVRRKVRRKLLPRLQCSQVKRPSWACR